MHIQVIRYQNMIIFHKLLSPYFLHFIDLLWDLHVLKAVFVQMNLRNLTICMNYLIQP